MESKSDYSDLPPEVVRNLSIGFRRKHGLPLDDAVPVLREKLDAVTDWDRSWADIAREVGCSDAYVSRYAKDVLGIVKGLRAKRTRRYDGVKDWNRPLWMIAEEVGVSIAAVSQYVKKYGPGRRHCPTVRPKARV